MQKAWHDRVWGTVVIVPYLLLLILPLLMCLSQEPGNGNETDMLVDRDV